MLERTGAELNGIGFGGNERDLGGGFSVLCSLFRKVGGYHK